MSRRTVLFFISWNRLFEDGYRLPDASKRFLAKQPTPCSSFEICRATFVLLRAHFKDLSTFGTGCYGWNCSG